MVSLIAANPPAGSVASPTPPGVGNAGTTSNMFVFTSFVELSAPPGVPFCEGAGAAKTASEPEFALAAEPAAKVGAVEGAEKPPSEDAIARTREVRLGPTKQPAGLRLITCERCVVSNGSDRRDPTDDSPIAPRANVTWRQECPHKQRSEHKLLGSDRYSYGHMNSERVQSMPECASIRPN